MPRASRNVLFIHYHFLPVLNVGVKRLVGYARLLPDFGWRPSVLSRQWDGIEGEDPSWGLTWEPDLECEVPCRIHRVADPSAPARARRGLRPADGRPMDASRTNPVGVVRRIYARGARIGGLLAGRYPDEFIHWARPAIAAGVEIARRDRIDVIVSYCPPATNHLVGRELARRLGVPWVPFFGDLYGFLDGRFPWYSVEGMLQRRWHRWCMAPAAACVAVSPAMTRHLEAVYGKSSALVLTGFDPDDFHDSTAAAARRSRFVVSHVGSVYPGDQRPEIFLEGLDRLLARDLEIAPRIEVLFVGSKCDDRLRGMVAGRPSASVCSFHSRVDSRTAVAFARDTDVLLAFTCSAYRDRHGTLSYPTKIFEAFGVRRPILAVPADGDFVDELLLRTGGGRSARDSEHVAAILGEWFAVWSREGRVPYVGKPAEIAEFTRIRRVERLSLVLESVCAGSPGEPRLGPIGAGFPGPSR